MQTRYETLRTPDGVREQQILSDAGRLLREGKLVIFPTETVYGLGANALDETAAARIYAAKGRPSDNPLIVHIADIHEADALTVTGDVYYRLARAFMPGPITVIMPAKPCIPRTVTAGLSTVAIRCPSHPIAHALLMEAGIPVAAPSANLSGSPSPTDGPHVKDDMDGRVDMILDGGECEFGVESTIVKIEDDGSLLLLRPGAVTVEDLQTVCPTVHIAPAVLGQLKEGEVALSPGMKYRHYAPKAPLFLLNADADTRRQFLSAQQGKIAYLCYDEEIPSFRNSDITLFPIGAEKDEKTQAQRLFRLLRDADKQNFDRIYAPQPTKTGMGMALYNRMIRAAAHQIITPKNVK